MSTTRIQARINALLGCGYNWGYVLNTVSREFGAKIECFNSGRLISVNGVKV